MAAPPFNFPPGYLAESKAPTVIAIITIFPSLALLVVLLRLYTRIVVVASASKEDWAILGALVFSIAMSICQGFQVVNGMGRHMYALTPQQGMGSMKALFASIMMYDFGITLTKTSIVLQYLRIAIDKKVRAGCWLLLFFVFSTCIEAFFTDVFTCRPVAKFWNDRIPGNCLNRNAIWFSNAGINIAQDIWLILLPIFILKNLAMGRREKITLMVILGLGGFASLASIFRLYALYSLTISKDTPWDSPSTAYWSTIELNVGIICASLPTVRPFIAKHFPGLLSSSVITRANLRGAYQYHSQERSGQRRANMSMEDAILDGGIIVKNDVDVDVENGKAPTFRTTDSDGDIPNRTPTSVTSPPHAQLREWKS